MTLSSLNTSMLKLLAYLLNPLTSHKNNDVHKKLITGLHTEIVGIFKLKIHFCRDH